MIEIGAYRVVGKLGEGGMGSVYVCEHALLGRRAAIKMLLPALSGNEEIVQRFFNEARAVTRICDPGIVQIFDFGFHVDGSAFIVMELLDGEPMDRRLARVGRFGVIECLRLSRLICTSLHAAHACGIVHRDLKPENLFLVGDPAVTGGERPKILDFGVAKLSGSESVFKTQTGMMLGTPVYMSPEQCRGSSDIDHRADIYSLGCVMFAMLAGRPPFNHASTGELIAAHMLEEPPRLRLFVEVARCIDDLVARCLAKDPRDRFQSMQELAVELGRVEEAVYRSTTETMTASTPSASWSGPVAVKPPTPTTMRSAAGESYTPPVPEPMPRRGGLVAVVAVVAAFAAAAVIAFVVLRDRASPAAAPAISASIAPRDAAIAGSIAAAILVPLADAPVNVPVPDAPVDAVVLDAPAPIDVAPPPHRPPPKRPPPHSGAVHDTTSEPEIDRGD
jgi:serine/threonine-protein kinase